MVGLLFVNFQSIYCFLKINDILVESLRREMRWL